MVEDSLVNDDAFSSAVGSQPYTASNEVLKVFSARFQIRFDDHVHTSATILTVPIDLTCAPGSASNSATNA